MVLKEFDFYLSWNEPMNRFHDVVREASTLAHLQRCRAAEKREEQATGLACYKRALG